MELYLYSQDWKDIDNYGSYTHTRTYKVVGWNEAILGPSPQLRRGCDVLPLEGDERYYTWECPPTWSMI